MANISASMSNLSVAPACHSSLFDCAGPIVNSQIHDPIHHCIPVLCLSKHAPGLHIDYFSETTKNQSHKLTYFLNFFDSTSSLPGRGSLKGFAQRVGQLFGRQSQGGHRPRPEGRDAMRCHEMRCKMAFVHSAVLGFAAGTWRDVSGGPGYHEVQLVTFRTIWVSKEHGRHANVITATNNIRFPLYDYVCQECVGSCCFCSDDGRNLTASL